MEKKDRTRRKIEEEKINVRKSKRKAEKGEIGRAKKE
jgi:hypothetical protein